MYIADRLSPTVDTLIRWRLIHCHDVLYVVSKLSKSSCSVVGCFWLKVSVV